MNQKINYQENFSSCLLKMHQCLYFLRTGQTKTNIKYKIWLEN